MLSKWKGVAGGPATRRRPKRGALTSEPKEHWCRARSFFEPDRLNGEAAQFANFFSFFEADALPAEECHNLRSQFSLERFASPQRLPQDLPRLFLHAAAIPLGARLQSRLEPVFQVPHQNLRHAGPPTAIMIALSGLSVPTITSRP